MAVEYIFLTEMPATPDTIIAVPEKLTVAEWRQAQQVAIKDYDQHALRQFKMATLMLELAASESVPDDALLMPSLGFGRIKADDPWFVRGADGFVRGRVAQSVN